MALVSLRGQKYDVAMLRDSHFHFHFNTFWSRAGVALVFVGSVWYVLGALSVKITFENQADGFAYYLPARSLYFDHDLQFFNEDTYYERRFQRIPYDWRHLSKTNYYIYPYAVGESLLLFPFLRTISPEYQSSIALTGGLSGFSNRSLSALVVGSRAYALGALVLTYFALRRLTRASSGIAWIAILTLFLSGASWYYFSYQPLMSHSIASFTIALVLFAWSRKQVNKWAYWLICGCAVGLAALVRWQNVIIAILPLATFLELTRRQTEPPTRLVFLAVGFVIGCMLVFLPQSLVWKVIYGTYFLIPQGSNFFSFQPKNVLLFLFSWKHGLLSWTPITIFAVIGLIRSTSRRKSFRHNVAFPVLASLSAAVFINSLNVDWHGSDAFGARRMVDMAPLFAFGLTSVINSSRLTRPIILVGIGMLIAYNVFFSYEYARQTWGHGDNITPVQVLSVVSQRIEHTFASRQ